eukprot:1511105-Ditylum_brightwellii.AAC.1
MSSSAIFSGISFIGATESAVVVASPLKSAFCHCVFNSNVKEDGQQGASIYARASTDIVVQYCTFENNNALKGSCITSVGRSEVSHCNFIENEGARNILLDRVRASAKVF